MRPAMTALTAFSCLLPRVASTQELDLSQYFGFGIAAMAFGDPHIESADVRAGVVQIVEKTDWRITPWLQTQYIFDGLWTKTNYLKPGVFIGVGLGPSGGALDTFGFGAMLAMKRTQWSDDSDARSLNVGIGMYTTKVRHFAPDTPEGGTLPMGVESVHFRTESDSGLMITLSFSI